MMKYIRYVIKVIMIGMYHILYYIIPINKKVIIFESSVGRNYTGNPRAIYEELVKQKLDQKYKCIWILEDKQQVIPGKCIKVKRQRIQYFYYMSIAKFWIMDSRQPSYLKKKKGNIYIQTWHGTPLKKLGLDMNFVNMGGYQNIDEYTNVFKQNTSRWDFLISQNEYSTSVFKSAFAFDKEILQIGYPRNDILINHSIKQIEVIKEKMGIPNNKKILLYAPTWRDNLYDQEGKYKFKLPIDLGTFQRELGDSYYLLLKPHYLITDQLDIGGYEQYVKVCDIKQDIRELYLISDMLITDYSSVMFDYSILGRPIIFFMYDIEEYRSEVREFYFDILKEAPGPIVENNKDLIDCIKNIERLKFEYINKYDAFKKRYTSLDLGCSADQVIKLVESYIS